MCKIEMLSLYLRDGAPQRLWPHKHTRLLQNLIVIALCRKGICQRPVPGSELAATSPTPTPPSKA